MCIPNSFNKIFDRSNAHAKKLTLMKFFFFFNSSKSMFEYLNYSFGYYYNNFTYVSLPSQNMENAQETLQNTENAQETFRVKLD